MPQPSPNTKIVEAQVILKDFPGLINNADPRDLPAGAGEKQTNLYSRILGQLTIRRGLIAVTFEPTSGGPPPPTGGSGGGGGGGGGSGSG